MGQFLRLAVIGILVAVLALPLVATRASAATSDSEEWSFSERVWRGLWAGSHVSLAPVADEPQTEPADDETPVTTGGYVALGDSVAAGSGLTPNAQDDERCERSPLAYPYSVAEELNLALTHIACRGATAGDLFTKQGVRGPNIDAQLETAFANGRPSLITVTAGANDVHWDDFVRKCYARTCGTTTDTNIAESYQALLEAKLRYALSNIQTRSDDTPPTVILTGYYNPVSMQCTDEQNYVTSDEIRWLNSSLGDLNRTIRTVSADYSFATYAPVSFRGHDICSSDPWVQGLEDPAPFHPTARGQEVIARSILRAYEREVR